MKTFSCFFGCLFKLPALVIGGSGYRIVKGFGGSLSPAVRHGSLDEKFYKTLDINCHRDFEVYLPAII